MEKRKKKIIITIAYIIAVIATPLIIGLLDTLLPSTFRMAIIVMYIMYVLITAMGCVAIVYLWGRVRNKILTDLFKKVR